MVNDEDNGTERSCEPKKFKVNAGGLSWLIWPRKFRASEETHNAWEIVFKFLSIFAAITVFFYGFYSYTRATKDTYRGKFWEKQLEVYSSLTELCGTIAGSSDLAKVALAEDSFWQIYNGKARLFVDSSVDRKMTNFAKELRMFRNSDESDRSQINYRSLELVLACRDSLSRAWDVDLGSIIPKSHKTGQ